MEAILLAVTVQMSADTRWKEAFYYQPLERHSGVFQPINFCLLLLHNCCKCCLERPSNKNFASKYGIENENMLMCAWEKERRRYWERERINCCVKSIKIRRFRSRLFVWIYVRISDYFYFRYVWNIFWYLLARSNSFQLIYGFFSFVWVLSVAAHSIVYWTNTVNFVRHVIVL